MQRLGKNVGRYLGETIDIQRVLREVDDAALSSNWIADTVEGAESFIAYQRPAAAARKRVYISAGIHGDEPAGPLAVLRLMQEDQWPEDVSLWLCPCLNPVGMAANTRENAEGTDLNRDYRHLQSAEVRAHVAWIARQPEMDLVLCLHEDWESLGFYLYELNPSGRASLGERIIDRVASVCPVDLSPDIEGWPAQHGIIRPAFKPSERPLWPESLYMVANQKTRQTCTLEAPSDFPLTTRVDALTVAVTAAIEALQVT
jgi:murein peptide amidase A